MIDFDLGILADGVASVDLTDITMSGGANEGIRCSNNAAMELHNVTITDKGASGIAALGECEVVGLLVTVERAGNGVWLANTSMTNLGASMLANNRGYGANVLHSASFVFGGAISDNANAGVRIAQSNGATAVVSLQAVDIVGNGAAGILLDGDFDVFMRNSLIADNTDGIRNNCNDFGQLDLGTSGDPGGNEFGDNGPWNIYNDAAAVSGNGAAIFATGNGYSPEIPGTCTTIGTTTLSCDGFWNLASWSSIGF